MISSNGSDIVTGPGTIIMQTPSLEESDLQFAMKLPLEELRPKLDINPDQVTGIVNIQSSNNIVDLCRVCVCRICNVKLQKQMK